MKNIIFFSKNLKIGGMEQALVTLLNKIDSQNYKVTLVLEKAEGPFLNNINKNVKIINYNLSTNKNIFIRKLTNFLKKFIFIFIHYHKYDCAISYATYSILGSQLARKSSKNTMLFIHSDYYNLYDANKTNILNFFSQIKINFFKKIIFISKHSMNNLIQVLPEIKSKSLVLGNLTDEEKIIEKAKEYNVHLEANKISLLYVGRLEEHSKQISKLINAVNISNLTDKFNLYILGSDPDEDYYKGLAHSPNIIFLGEKENPYPYIKASDYIILSSKYEGFPMVYNEATLLGTKIITTIPVEDDQIKYDINNTIILDQDLKNFNYIIQQISQNNLTISSSSIDFSQTNYNKLNKFYKLIES